MFVARSYGEGDLPAQAMCLIVPSLFPPLWASFSVFFGPPGFLFSSVIIKFNCLFLFGATFLPADRRTYKQYGRFRIRSEVIRQNVRISLPASFWRVLFRHPVQMVVIEVIPMG